MKSSVPRSSRALAALLASLPAIVPAATLTWDGDGFPDVGGNWSVAVNWSSDTAPTASDTAVLDDVSTGTRTVNYDASAASALTSLVFNQSTAGATNLLNIQRSLTIANAITLGATDGIARITVATPASGSNTLTAAGGLTLETNGVLALNAANNVFGNFSGALTISGGSLLVSGSTHTGSVTNTVSGALTMSSGSISIENNGSAGQTQADRRLTVTGDVNITGGTISTTRSGTSGMLTFTGATIVFNPTSFDNDPTITLDRNGDQSITTSQALTGTLLFRGTGVKTLARTGGATVGALTFIDSSTSSATGTALKLGSDLSLNTNAAQPNAVNFSQSVDGAGVIQLGIDHNGFTLDLSSGASSGVWTPNKSTQAGVNSTVWTLANSGPAGVGSIKANAFNFASTGVTVNVGSGVALRAIGGNGTATNLGSAGTFASDASFTYAGSAAAGAPATLSSGRAIGALRVESGALQIAGSNFAAAGGIVVKSGGLLDFTTQTVSANTITLGVDGASFGAVKALGNYAFGGDLAIDFGLVSGGGMVFDFFQFTGAHTDGASFSSVSITGAHSATLLLNAGVWTGAADGLNFSFDQVTGDLSVTSAIPEPSSFVALSGFVAIGCAAFLRRRRA